MIRPARLARPVAAPGPEPDPMPRGVVPITAPLDAVMRRLALRLDELAALLGVSRRAIERARSAGRFPRPDVTIGRMPLWRPETIRAWLERGGRP